MKESKVSKKLVFIIIAIVAVCVVLAGILISFPSYERLVENLPEEGGYAIVNTSNGESLLFLTDMVSQQEDGPVCYSCDVYKKYKIGYKKLGSLVSNSTANPIKFDLDGFYAGSGEEIDYYEINSTKLSLVSSVGVEYDDDGNIVYVSGTGEDKEVVEQSVYEEMLEKYENAQLVFMTVVSN